MVVAQIRFSWLPASGGWDFGSRFWSVINRNRLEIVLFRQRNRNTILFNKSNPLPIRRYITYELSYYRNPYLLLLRYIQVLHPTFNNTFSLQMTNTTRLTPQGQDRKKPKESCDEGLRK